ALRRGPLTIRPSASQSTAARCSCYTPQMALKESQKKFLRGMGHQLKPVITVGGAGLTDTVQKEFDSSIAHHELIKVRIRVGDRESRDDIIEQLCTVSGAELVTRIGNVALFYRQNPEQPRIPLPV
ncbi:MAG: ribosome assembly RNA-binding protein YhbY, partial [Pseudomonadota bacterium]